MTQHKPTSMRYREPRFEPVAPALPDPDATEVTDLPRSAGVRPLEPHRDPHLDRPEETT